MCFAAAGANWDPSWPRGAVFVLPQTEQLASSACNIFREAPVLRYAQGDDLRHHTLYNVTGCEGWSRKKRPET